MKKAISLLLALVLWLCDSVCGEITKGSSKNKTTAKDSILAEENVEFIKSIDNDVTITVCAPEGQYTDIMISILPEYYGVVVEAVAEVECIQRTIDILKRYQKHNDKINVKYVDPQSTEFSEIITKYLNDYSFFYGDMIVSSTIDGNERVRVLNFDDIYVTTLSDFTYQYEITENKLETTLSNAINYVTNDEIKSVAVLTGHNNGDSSSLTAYVQLLERNNYTVTEISDQLITSISRDFDIIVISAPTTDFIKDELDVISDFLDNDGKLGKGLIYFADASSPHLPTLSAWLKGWGVEVSEGMLFGTDDGYYIPGSPTTLGTLPVSLSDDDITQDLLQYYSISESNVPMKAVEISSYKRKATALMQTGDDVVIAPIGSAATWDDYDDDDKQTYDTVIQSKETDVDSEGNELSSYVMAFSSARLLQSTWSSYSQLCNQDIVALCTDRAAHVEDINVFEFPTYVVEKYIE